jgi:hypothetical protein
MGATCSLDADGAFMAPTSSSIALRLRASGMPVRPGALAKCFPSQKLGAIVETLREEGVRSQAVLAGADLAPEQIEDPATRVSYSQIFRVLANAARLATAADTAIRAGQRMHLSAYGMYGVRADPNLTHPADRILTRGQGPTV